MSRSGRDTRSLLLAGWLFADLLAMLFVISLAAAQTRGGAAAAGNSPSPSPSPGKSAHPSPSPDAKTSTAPNPPPTSAVAAKIGLDPAWAPIVLTDIDLDELRSGGADGPMAKKVVSEMNDALAKAAGGTRQVGLIATFTQTPTNVYRGDKMSELVDAALIKNHPQFAHAAQLPLWQAGPEGSVQVKVFFLNQ